MDSGHLYSFWHRKSGRFSGSLAEGGRALVRVQADGFPYRCRSRLSVPEPIFAAETLSLPEIGSWRLAMIPMLEDPDAGTGGTVKTRVAGKRGQLR
jgi:hypothetical protein